ncbi:MAG: AgmX/PglI C-terminal domain-containing protein [Deltaproteobacteria bacterium]|nr:AgmX/PglI C-terminal domain-containing protein [Deltaproteobacteria bacterium]
MVVARELCATARRARLGLVVLASALAACAAATPQGALRGPSPRAVHEALELVTPLAERCLRPGDRVTVEGVFDGPTGRLHLDRAGALAPETPVRSIDCVMHTLELARVPPFRAPGRSVRWTVARRGPEDAGTEPAFQPRPVQQEGTIDPALVAAVVQAHLGAVRDCYEAALAGDPRLAGRVEVHLTITVEGRATDVRATGPEAFRSTMRCVEGLFGALRFPSARGGSVVFFFPFEFSPEAAPRASPSTPR